MRDVKGLNLQPVDGRTVRLHVPLSYREEVNGTDIVRLHNEEETIEIKIGSSVTYRKTKHKVNVITRGIHEGKLICYDLKCAKLTSSSTFALPFLGGNKKYMLWDSLFVNAFISTPEYDECIALLYRFSGDRMFTKFEEAMCAMPTFIKFEDVDTYHVLFVFDIPDSARNSYKRFREGQYSKIDDIWKLMILDYHDYKADGKTGQILYKDPELRKSLEVKLDIELGDSELHSIPDMRYERFDKEYYKV